MKKIVIVYLLPLVFLFACKQENSSDHPALVKKVDVFGIIIYATESAPDNKLLHSANVLAEFLDNDEDGIPDNQLVVDALNDKNAILVMTPNSSTEWELIHPDLHYMFPDAVYHDNFANEANPRAIADGSFDGLWEETLHLITRHGWGNAYPSVFGLAPGTDVADAVDAARGGHFQEIPDQYPEKAWYSYYDESCEYGCQIDEYVFWALTSILGTLEVSGRGERSVDEWKLYTRELVMEHDPAIHALLTNPEYRFPTVIPHGDYSGGEFTIEGCNLEIKVQEENFFPPEGRYPAIVNFITECQAPGGEATKISFTIDGDSEYRGRKLCLMSSSSLTTGSELYSILTDITPTLKELETIRFSDMKSIEGLPVWLTTEPMTGSAGSVFPKVVGLESR